MSSGGELWKLFFVLEWGTNHSLRGKVCLGRARNWRKLCKLTIIRALSKTVSEDSIDTSCTPPTDCFWTLDIESHYKKMHISEYVCKTCLTELAINTQGNPPKISQPLTFLKIMLLSFSHIKSKYFLEHPTMVTAGNVT